jgi:proline iminopeptidase
LTALDGDRSFHGMSRVLLVFALATVGAAQSAAAQSRIFNKQRVTYTNGPLTLVGYVYHPDGRGPFPTVIWNHGSEHDPGRGPQFDSVAAIFVPAGYAVFAPMRRGHSDSQGQWIQDTIHATVSRQGMPAAERLMVRLMGTEQLDDQLAGLAYARTLPFVDANRVVVAGCSYGGIETLLAAERGAGLKAAFSISPAALSWQGHTVLQHRLIDAVRKIDMPVLLIQPPRDASLEPARVLGEAAKKAGRRSFTAKVYPPTMPEAQQAHCFGGAIGMRNWAAEAVSFFNGVLGRTGRQVRDGYVLTSDSARLYYRIAGEPGPGVDTIITVHGGPGLDMESIYNDFAAMLSPTHVVIFYDQRGGGKSELPADTTRLFASRQIQDLDELRRHFGLEKLTLVAHSYGPLLAASYALAHPANVKRMIFFGPVPPRRGDFFMRYGRNLNARLDSAQRARMSVDSRRMVDTSLSDADTRAACRDYWKLGLRPRLADPEQLDAVKSDLCATDVRGIRYGNRIGNRVIMSSYGDWDLRERLHSLRVPLLVIHGEQETIPMDLVEEWVTSMPAGMATLLKVPRAAHFTYAERRDVVWPAVERFLSADER